LRIPNAPHSFVAGTKVAAFVIRKTLFGRGSLLLAEPGALCAVR